MGRPRVGSTYIKDGIRQIAILTDRPGALRPRWVRPCPPGKDGQALTVIEAKKIALDLQRSYDRGEWDPWAPKPVEAPVPVAIVAEETVDQWFERWLVDRTARGLTSVRTDRSRYRIHVAPTLGHLAIRSVDRGHFEELVEQLDLRVRAGELSWKTATNSWGIASKMFSDASSAKSRRLRVRPDNPCLGVAPPDRGTRKVKQYLWPSEFLKLVSCPVVPLVWRRVYALAVYSYARLGELEALDWADVDLQQGIAHIHRAIDYDTNKTKPIKTKEARRFRIEPNLLPLLERMLIEASGAARVWPKGAVRNNDAMLLREHLKVAGVTRADLFTNDATRKQITAHDLRSTGITWAIIRGDSHSMVQRRAGHTHFGTTDDYVREAEVVREGFGEVFPPLPAEVLGVVVEVAPISDAPPGLPPSSEPSGGSATGCATSEMEKPREPLGFSGFLLCEEGDLNPHDVTR